MINQIIGLFALIALVVTAVLLGVCLAKKKTGWAVLCAMFLSALFSGAGYYLSLPSSVSAAKYLQAGESVMAVAHFTEMKSDGSDVQKVVAKIREGYVVLDLPPINDFEQAQKAYRVNGTSTQKAGLLKVEQVANEFGPDLTVVSFKPTREDPQSRWRNTGKN